MLTVRVCACTVTQQDGINSARSHYLNGGAEMMGSTESLIMVLECKAAQKVKMKIADRIRLGVCIGQRPDGSECDGKSRCRGLCTKCERRWRITRLKMTAQKALAYDSRLIRSGRLLKPLEVVGYFDKSAFTRLAKSS